MVELLVFAPGEEIDDKEFAEVMLRIPGANAHHARPVVLDQFGEARGEVRFAMRRRPGLNPRDARTVNPLSVKCPGCGAEAWDPCAEHVQTGLHTGYTNVSLHTHEARHDAARKPAQ